ncbi:MAG: outer membrane beta-barrel protein [Christiangramia sp.]|nr:outer membrane beta-barrel protein [Christiangramia sp.]
MKNYFLFFALFLCVKLYSQIEFEKGYFITNQGQRTDCLIKNSDWNYNPSSFTYKDNAASEAQSIGIEDIQEIEVGNFHFKKFKVKIDISGQDIDNISTERAPDFETQVILLRYLVEGDISLLGYRRNNLERFYVKVEGEEAEPLIYKNYLVKGKLAENNRFKQQLATDFNCGNNAARLKYIEYKQKDLVEFFSDYSECLDKDFEIRLDKKTSGYFSITPKIGIGAASVDVDRGLVAAGAHLDGLEYRIGAELEYTFNFNRNKWSAIFEPLYSSFSDEVFVEDYYSADLKVDYNLLNMFTGIRYYMFLENKSKLFANLGLDMDLPVNSSVEFANTGRNMDPVLEEFDFSLGYGIGMGYDYNNKLNIELRYSTNKINGDKFVERNYNMEWRSNYNSFNLILGYTIL